MKLLVHVTFPKTYLRKFWNENLPDTIGRDAMAKTLSSPSTFGNINDDVKCLALEL